jgi:peptidoglycan hydrolase CwlO-like protein
MWPKALAQLIELAPYIARMLPTADRYLQSRAVNDQATREALAKMGDDVRADINRVTASHEGIYRQLNEQGERFAQLNEQMTAVREAAEAAEERVAALEQRVGMSSALLAILLPLNVILLALVIYIVVRH